MTEQELKQLEVNELLRVSQKLEKAIVIIQKAKTKKEEEILSMLFNFAVVTTACVTLCMSAIAAIISTLIMLVIWSIKWKVADINKYTKEDLEQIN